VKNAKRVDSLNNTRTHTRNGEFLKGERHHQKWEDSLLQRHSLYVIENNLVKNFTDFIISFARLRDGYGNSLIGRMLKVTHQRQHWGRSLMSAIALLTIEMNCLAL